MYVESDKVKEKVRLIGGGGVVVVGMRGFLGLLVDLVVT